MAKPNYVSVTSDKSKKGAFFRCLIGGIFGWHYFYVGRVGRGLMCLPTFGNFFNCRKHPRPLEDQQRKV